MNRNLLKIIAVISMLVDHIGAVFFKEYLIFRIMGRIAFPIFAYFIAEGYYYTKSKPKYVTKLLFFAIVSQVPYYFLFNTYSLNILFTFLLSILLMYLFEKVVAAKYDKDINIFNFILANVVVLVISAFNFIDYGYLGVLLPLAVFVFKQNKKWQFIAILSILLTLSVSIAINDLSNFYYYMQFFSLLAVPILYFYNGNKGKYNLKYFFYSFYLFHLVVLLIIKLML